MERRLTISVFTENKYGLLNRVTIIFTRRKLNIESITASESEIEGLYRYTIVLTTTREMAHKVVQQLEKQIGIRKAFVHEEDEIHHQEIALYKIPLKLVKKGVKMEQLIRDNHARILAIEEEYIVIEKTGHPHETQRLYDILKPYGVMEFARSGRVAITRPMKELHHYLKEHDKMYNGVG